MRIFFLLLIPCFTFAQKKTISQQLNYFKYQLNVQASKKLTIKNEIENRSYLWAGRQNQFITKCSFENKLPKSNLIGFSLAYSKATSPQDPDEKINNITHELRPSIYFQYSLLAKKKSLLNARCTEEFRFFKREGPCFKYSNVRSRFLMEYNYSLTNKLIFKTYDELLINALGLQHVNLFDQQRFSVGGQYNFSKRIGFEMVYQNWYQMQNDGITYFDKNILKVTIIQKLAL